MTKPELHCRTARRSKKNIIPLIKLRTSEVVRTVVNHPRRLEELINLLRDKERSIRGRAAATLSRLSESHPARLVRCIESLREALGDDSAFVRWHLLYTLGQVIAHCPRRASCSLGDIKTCLADEDKVVRSFACRALESVASRQPQLVRGLFSAKDDEMPLPVARVLQKSSPHTKRSTNKHK
jgi:HEAT repeat protein